MNSISLSLDLQQGILFPAATPSLSSSQMDLLALGPRTLAAARILRISAPSGQTTMARISIQSPSFNKGYTSFTKKQDMKQGEDAKDAKTHHARFLWPHNPLLHPNCIAPHEVRHHYIRRQPIPDDGDLLWLRHARLRVLPEILHDLGPAAWLLGGVRQHGDARSGLDGARVLAAGVERRGAGGVGDD